MDTKPYACILCSQRKVKCDRKDPCNSCTKSHLQCIFRAPNPPRRRKRASPEAILLARLKRYEEVLKNLGVDTANLEKSPLTGAEIPETGGSKSPPAAVELIKVFNTCADPGAIIPQGRYVSGEGKSRYIENNLWTSVHDEFGDPKELLEQGSGADDLDITPILDDLNLSGSDLVLGPYSPHPQLTALHPDPDTIKQLWNIFVTNADPLIKILHTPTVGQEILSASADVSMVSREMAALMFSIYLLAVTTLNEAECEAILQETKPALLSRYRYAVRHALMQAGLLKTSDLVVLQAYVLFLLSIRQFYDPASLWPMTGIAVRIGQRIGLHRDGGTLGILPFETEIRRRIWWQILIMDGLSAELSGVGSSVSAYSFDTKVPLNINDADLVPGMVTPPSERTGATDMIFCLLRCEVGQYLRQTRSTNAFEGIWAKDVRSVFLHGTSMPSSQEGSFSLAERDKVVNDLESLLERKFLRYCDLITPLHYQCHIMARTVVCRLRLEAHHPRQYLDGGAHLPQQEKDLLFATALKMIEYANLAYTNESIKRYRFHSAVYFQRQALIYLLGELRSRTMGDEVDKAWQQIGLLFENHTDMIQKPKNPLNIASRSLTLKAWEARQEALELLRPDASPEVPPFILTFYEQATSAKATPATIKSNESSEQQKGEDASSGGETSMLTEPVTSSLPIEISPMNWVEWDHLIQDFDMQGFDEGSLQIYDQE